jgi:hypothetical protein
MTSGKFDLSAKLESLHSLEDIRAVAPGASVIAHDRKEASEIAAKKGVDAEDARAFEQAGWTFVQAGHAPTGDAEHAVFVDADGHLKILSNALNVKFEPSLSRNSVEKILDQHDLSIRRDLGFSPNLFIVTGAGDDAVAKAKSLNQLDSVLYAEPVLIDVLKGR